MLAGVSFKLQRNDPLRAYPTYAGWPLYSRGGKRRPRKPALLIWKRPQDDQPGAVSFSIVQRTVRTLELWPLLSALSCGSNGQENE